MKTAQKNEHFNKCALLIVAYVAYYSIFKLSCPGAQIQVL